MSFAKPVRNHILAIAKAYAEATGLPVQVVLRRAYGNGNFHKKLKTGGNISIDKVDDMMAWFRQSWPEGGEWPFLSAIFLSRTGK